MLITTVFIEQPLKNLLHCVAFVRAIKNTEKFVCTTLHSMLCLLWLTYVNIGLFLYFCLQFLIPPKLELYNALLDQDPIPAQWSSSYVLLSKLEELIRVNGHIALGINIIAVDSYHRRKNASHTCVTPAHMLPFLLWTFSCSFSDHVFSLICFIIPP